MYELKESDLHLVGGGNGGSQGASQTCNTLSGGGTRCTSNNGNAMIVQTYDKNDKLTDTTTCSLNRSFSASAGNKAISGRAAGGGGSSCSGLSPSGVSSASGAASAPNRSDRKGLIVQMTDFSW